MSPLSTIIIEDEPHARISLKNDLLAYCPEVSLCGEAGDVDSAIHLIQTKSPDLIFLDIELMDGSGFQVLRGVKDWDFQVVFTTAYSQHAIRAFELSATHYLLKPFSSGQLVEAVERARSRSEEKQAAEKIRLMLENGHQNNQQKQKICLPTQTGLHIFRMEEIIRLESESNYTKVCLEKGKELWVAKTLKAFEKMLEPAGFLRVHQSHLVNIIHIKQYQNRSNSCLILSEGQSVPVSSRRRPMLLSALKDLI